MKVTLASLAKHNYWHGKYQNSSIDVVCLLWNGMFIKLSDIRADLPLEKIKENLWLQKGKHSKEPKEHYVFVVVSSNHGTEELVDEKLSLFDIKPVKPYLKVTRKQGNEEIKKIKSKINMLIGHNISTCKQEEVKEAQKSLSDMCSRISIQRGKSSWYKRAIYTYPPDFEEDNKLPSFLEEKFPKKRIHISVSVLKNSSNCFEVEYAIKPLELIKIVLSRRAQILRVENIEDPEQYILKVLGSESFFLGNIVMEGDQEFYKEIPLIQYKYIREALYWDKRPTLMVMKREDMDICALTATNQDYLAPLLPNRQSKRNKSINLWDLSPKAMFKVKINYGLDLNAGKLWDEVWCGVFHGGDQVCETRSTSRKEGSSPRWNEFLEFDLSVCDIPRMARLCFCIVGYQNSQSKKALPLAWVNMPLFNYKGFLQTGSFQSYCWRFIKKSDRREENLTFNPLGTVMNSNECGPCLAFELLKDDTGRPVVYPSEEDVFEKAANDIKQGTQESDGENILLVKGGKQHKEQIEDIIKRDSLASMFEQDKELLWRLRAECCLEYPESLPKLLQCVKWNNKEQVAQIHFLLQSWNCKTLEVEIALELLDYKFPDLKVRQRAVEVLNNISDNQLEMYLLHLVQALKYESYLDSPLARYLLKRALNNRRIGHYLFWHLKADVGNAEHSLQFGLLLELYCFGAVEHIDSLYKQVDLMKKLKNVSDILKDVKEDKEKVVKMKDCLEGFSRTFENLVSPLDPRQKMKQLRIEQCKMMSSKKKPFWLVFQNYDDKADDVYIIFKSGDDLRQDMLTLLSLRLMDSVWKAAGLDYGIIPYRCLATGPSIGLIQVVTNAQTVASIQSKSGVIRGALKPDVLYKWLESNSTPEKNQGQVSPLSGDERLELFISNFTRSVVAYSVGMYVLGVGDRHNDNIMMKEDTGQLFHIDFGHFLGNFKTKLGFKRERAKFVLTSDFIYVIAKNGDDDAYNRFKNMCLEAFSCLRERGNLFITVFAMLLSSGIPELRQPTDIDYLRDSLAILKDEADAQKHFLDIFDEAESKGGWATINFMMHNVIHHR